MEPITLIVLALVFIAVTMPTYQFFASRLKPKVLISEETHAEKGGLFTPLIRALASLNERTVKIEFIRARINRRLATAGHPYHLELGSFLLLSEVCALLLPLLMFLIRDQFQLGLSLILILVGLWLPDFWLGRKMLVRQQTIVRDLPDAIDLIILSVDAGLDFMAAVNRIVDRSAPGPLREELEQMVQETRMGTTRRAALRSMAERVAVYEVTSLVSVLRQAEELGTPIAPALRNYANQMRNSRIQKAEKMAGEAPVKMLIPMIIFIFPVIFIIVLGPVLLSFLAT